MEIIYKQKNKFNLTNIPDDEFKLFQKNYDVFKDFKITDRQRKSIYLGTSFTLENGEVILGDETEYLEKEKQENIKKVKKQKSVEILAIASITDQINLITEILSEIIVEKPLNKRTTKQKKGLTVFNDIKNILNK